MNDGLGGHAPAFWASAAWRRRCPAFEGWARRLPLTHIVRSAFSTGRLSRHNDVNGTSAGGAVGAVAGADRCRWS